MGVLDRIHQKYVYDRRTRVLSRALTALIPANARVLDVGCGDGLISKMILTERTDLTIEGIDIKIRAKTHVPVKKFDGRRLPYTDNSFDAVMCIDVLHHTREPSALLREVVRVSSCSVVIKDHIREGFLAGPTLQFMDWVGNARHGIPLIANYWTEKQWRALFAQMNLEVCHWTQDVPLYPWWASWWFGRTLHYISHLKKQTT